MAPPGLVHRCQVFDKARLWVFCHCAYSSMPITDVHTARNNIFISNLHPTGIPTLCWINPGDSRYRYSLFTSFHMEGCILLMKKSRQLRPTRWCFSSALLPSTGLPRTGDPSRYGNIFAPPGVQTMLQMLRPRQISHRILMLNLRRREGCCRSLHVLFHY